MLRIRDSPSRELRARERWQSATLRMRGRLVSVGEQLGDGSEVGDAYARAGC
jgi:hypothetical protein